MFNHHEEALFSLLNRQSSSVLDKDFDLYEECRLGILETIYYLDIALNGDKQYEYTQDIFT